MELSYGEGTWFCNPGQDARILNLAAYGRTPSERRGTVDWAEAVEPLPYWSAHELRNYCCCRLFCDWNACPQPIKSTLAIAMETLTPVASGAGVLLISRCLGACSRLCLPSVIRGKRAVAERDQIWAFEKRSQYQQVL
ncbi:hypothetical protein AAFF_G00042160 [Aldrovandia affinis]|uniref:Uncharacterized protein n=1 Tax=Aldrovandia affinis TaxID=143900 RepID=A0AAD7S2R3_9TELE|nr:hypothetical protein AAFF_G00042160 [Aldrovandia affinis]